jgi:hypothetical protein
MITSFKVPTSLANILCNRICADGEKVFLSMENPGKSEVSEEWIGGIGPVDIKIECHNIRYDRGKDPSIAMIHNDNLYTIVGGLDRQRNMLLALLAHYCNEMNISLSSVEYLHPNREIFETASANDMIRYEGHEPTSDNELQRTITVRTPYSQLGFYTLIHTMDLQSRKLGIVLSLETNDPEGLVNILMNSLGYQKNFVDGATVTSFELKHSIITVKVSKPPDTT